MKLPHWVLLFLGAIGVGLAGIEGQLSGNAAVAARLVAGICTALTTGLGIASPSALKQGAP